MKQTTEEPFTLHKSPIVKWLTIPVVVVVESVLLWQSKFAYLYLPVLVLTSGPFNLAVLGIAFPFCLVASAGAFDATLISIHVVPQLLVAMAFARRDRLLDDTLPSGLRRFLFERHARALRAWLLAGALVCLISMAFNSVNPLVAGVWAALLWTVRRSVPAPATGPPFRWMVAIGNAFLLVATVALSLGIVEFAGRMALEWKPCPGQFTQTHPKYIYTLAPDSQVTFPVAAGNRSFTAGYRISSQGIRDRVYGPKQENEFRIVMIGDSFTAGHGVSLDESIPKTLERLLQQEPLTKTVSVVNAGVDGYSAWQERGFLLERGLGFEPDMVILQIFLGNDLDGSLEEKGKFLRAYNEGWKRNFYYYVFGGYWQVRTNRWLRTHSACYERLLDATGGAGSIITLFNSLRGIEPVPPLRLPAQETRPFYLEQALEQWYPELDEAWTLLQKSVLAIKADCDQRRLEFLTFDIPGSNVVLDSLWERDMEQWGDKYAYDRSKERRLVQEFCARESIPYTDVWDALHDYSDPEQTYFIPDGHLQPKGTQIVAQCLRDYLMAHVFPQRGLLESEPQAPVPAPAVASSAP